MNEIEKIESLMRENKIWADVYHKSNFPSQSITLKIDGDWKHDHIFARNLMAEIGYNEVREDVIGESNEDFYTSEHTFLKMPKEMVDALRVMLGTK